MSHKPQSSGILPRQRPSAPVPRQTQGLARVNAQIQTVRADSLPKTKRGSR